MNYFVSKQVKDKLLELLPVTLSLDRGYNLTALREVYLDSGKWVVLYYYTDKKDTYHYIKVKNKSLFRAVEKALHQLNKLYV